MKTENAHPFFDIKKIYPNITPVGIAAFNNLFKLLEKYYKMNNVSSELSLESYSTFYKQNDCFFLFQDIIIDFIISDDIPEITDDDRKKIKEYANIFYEELKNDSRFNFLIKDFYTAEYIKRNYFNNKIKNGCKNLEELQEFVCLSEWRKKREDRIARKVINADCDLGNCYFRKEKGRARKNLKHPFFYNFDCRPPYQYNDSPCCNFKTDILKSIIALHNEKNPDFSDRFNDLRLDSYIANANIITWSKDFRNLIEILHNVTYEYGLFVFDLFGLASPNKIMNDSINNKTQIHEEIIKTIQPEFFLKKGDSDKLFDSENMAVIRRDPNKPTIDLNLLEQISKHYEFVIGIDSDITSHDFSIKKELKRIRKALKSFIPSAMDKFDPIKHQSQYIVFAFNPSAQFFIKRIRYYMTDVVLIINAYRSALVSLEEQINDYQIQLIDIYERIQYVKSYQETDQPRLIGLYIWDQVHLLKNSLRDSIKAFVDSSLYEKIMKLTKNEIEVRNESEKVKGIRGSQENRDSVFRNYEYTNCCIEKGRILTGEESERIIYPDRHSNKSRAFQE